MSQPDLEYALRGAVILARREYHRRRKRLPPPLALEDLISEAQLGVLEGARRHDGRAGVALTTYCWAWARGRIQQAIRAAHHLSRTHQAALLSGREPETTAFLPPISLAALVGDDWEPAGPDDPSAPLCREAEAELLWRCVASLPRREAQVLVQYYVHGLQLGEIARRMGRSRTRATQLHAQALSHLRERFPRMR